MMSPDGSFSEQLNTLTKGWEQANQETQRVKKQFVTSGTLGPGGKIAWPERWLDSQGLREINEAERNEKGQWDALLTFINKRRPKLD